MEEDLVCGVCCQAPSSSEKVQLKCKHVCCASCLKDYIKILKDYRQLTPQKLLCLQEGCEEEIDDDTLLLLFPGEEGFVLKMIKKCWKESKNKSNVIFSCKGIMNIDRTPLISKTEITREQHTN